MMRKSKTCGKPVPGEIIRAVALGMADGQIEQADRWLTFIDGRGPKPRNSTTSTPQIVALEHLRSACGWLVSAAEHSL
jgi:hypothetical protein